MTQLTLPKGAGTIIGNLLRQIALTQVDATCLIAYSVGDSSNVISAENNNVLEDMVEFSNNLSEYVYDIDTDYARVEVTFSDVLIVKHLQDEGLTVYVPEQASGELLHLLDGSIKVTLYFRKNHNYDYADDNRLFLESKGVDLTNVVVINSRYKYVKQFSFEVEPLDEKHESLKLNIRNFKDETDDDALIEILKKLDSILDFRE